VQNAGANPNYTWLVNGQPLVGQNGLTLDVSNLQNGDQVQLVLNSGYQCAVPLVDTSNAIVVTINPNPVIQCNAVNTVVVGQPSNIQANVTVGQAPFSYVWDLGNGQQISGTSNTNNLSLNYQYGGPNTYNITLTVTDANGCTSSCQTTATVVVPSPVKGDFVGDVLIGCSPLTVNFTSNITGNPTDYEWDFGDGNTSNLPNPTHTYNQFGFYTVRLIVKNGLYSDTTIKVNYVQVYKTPEPSISIANIVACEGLPVIFIDSGTEAYSRIWDFGDGNTSTLGNPAHIYTTSGTYNVTLTAINFNGLCQATATYSIDVKRRPIPNFEYIVSGSCNPLSVQFNNTTNENGGTGTTYLWDFGDGGKDSTNVNPVHTYTQEGTYSVTLIATNAQGCSDTLILYDIIQVAPNIQAGFTVSNTEVELPNANIDITDNSTGASSWTWSFGNGQTSNDQNPGTISYTTAGDYEIIQYVGNSFGCIDSFKITIRVLEGVRLFIPNVFTPNSDGMNDVFKIESAGIEYTLKIWDRWGKLVFDNEGDENKFWNGLLFNTGKPCIEGVYVYVLEGTKNKDGKKIKRQGSLTLLR
jgi:gliding motility-associated-like protein